MSAEPPAGDGAASPAGAVSAAGGVVWRRHDGELQVLVVHRPHRQDWSLPKGKVDPGESVQQAACREVREETGFSCHPGIPLGTVSYLDHKARPKTVWYWVMHIAAGEERLNDEVDEMAWCSAARARAILSYPTDREVLDRFFHVAEQLPLAD